MVIAIEPMISLGSFGTEVLANGWTVVTDDHKAAAHYENTIAITEDGPVVLTQDEVGPWLPMTIASCLYVPGSLIGSKIADKYGRKRVMQRELVNHLAVTLLVGAVVCIKISRRAATVFNQTVVDQRSTGSHSFLDSKDRFEHLIGDFDHPCRFFGMMVDATGRTGGDGVYGTNQGTVIASLFVQPAIQPPPPFLQHLDEIGLWPCTDQHSPGQTTVIVVVSADIAGDDDFAGAVNDLVSLHPIRRTFPDFFDQGILDHDVLPLGNRHRCHENCGKMQDISKFMMKREKYFNLIFTC